MKRRSILHLVTLAFLGAIVACTGASEDVATDGASALSIPKRDWVRNPAVLEVNEADELFALSDPHGGYVELGHLLEVAGLVKGFSSDPKNASSARWSGGTAILVITGDLIDKGPDSIAVIDFVRALQASAPAGRVIVTMGNHEAEFLADPNNDKALATTADGVGITFQLKAMGLSARDLAEGKDAPGRGLWMSSLPFGVRIKKWFFAHGGNTNGDSIAKLSERLQSGIDKNGYEDDDVIGKDSVLEAQEWYGRDFKKGKDNAKKLGVDHIAFGHDPGALSSRGDIIQVEDGALVKLNVNMGMAHERSSNVAGQILHVFTRGRDTAEVIDAKGKKTPLF